MSATLQSIASSNEFIRLAPNTSYPEDIGVQPYKVVSAVDTSAALTEILALTGKYAIGFIEVISILNAQSIDVKLTIDGVVIWDDNIASSGTALYLLPGRNQGYIVNESLSLEIRVVTDTNISLYYQVHPIL